MVYDAPHLAAVEVEFTGDDTLAVTGVVPGPYRLLHAWRSRQFGRCEVV